MSNTLKLLIPVGLGIVAAIINFIVLSSSTAEVTFAVASEDIPIGASFDGKVDKVGIPKNNASGLLEKKVAIQYKNSGVLRGQKASTRELKKGDLILYSDFDIRDNNSIDYRKNNEVARTIQLDGNQIFASNIGDRIWFEIPKYSRVTTDSNDVNVFRMEGIPEKIGPYRIIGIGSQVASQSDGYSFNGDSVTVAYERNPSQSEALQIKKLNEFVTDRELDSTGNVKIIGVEIMSADNYWETYKKDD